MECNKDEAIRAKEIAEKKLLERDVTGAKKFALKAQSLFPKLDGLSQFLEIIDVYVDYENKINGVANYYGILGVDPFADDIVLRKQYRKMALSLHPDKNKSVGADEAFKILSQAWDVLSDNDKRCSYNLKINMKVFNQTGGFNTSSSAMNTTTSTKSQHVPTQPKTTPRSATSQQYASAPHNPTDTKSGPAAATTSGPAYNPKTCKPFTGLNKGEPVKKRHTYAQKCDGAYKRSQRARGNGSDIIKGSENLKGNLSSTTHTRTRNHMGSFFNSSSARNTTTTTNPRLVRTRPENTTGTATTQQYASVKKRRMDVQKSGSINKESQGTAVNCSSVKRNHTSAKPTTCCTNPKQIPTRPKTSGTTTSQQCNYASSTSSKNIASRVQTQAATKTICKSCNPVSGLNIGKPIKREHVNGRKYDTPKERSQGVKCGSAHVKGNASTTYAVTRKHHSNHKVVKNN